MCFHGSAPSQALGHCGDPDMPVPVLEECPVQKGAWWCGMSSLPPTHRQSDEACMSRISKLGVRGGEGAVPRSAGVRMRDG